MAPDGSGGLWISTVNGVLGPGGMLHVSGGTIKPWRLPSVDGSSPEVRLNGAPGGDGPAFGAGFYLTERGNESFPGNVVLEQRQVTRIRLAALCQVSGFPSRKSPPVGPPAPRVAAQTIPPALSARWRATAKPSPTGRLVPVIKAVLIVMAVFPF
jgi:hypothetical protein